MSHPIAFTSRNYVLSTLAIILLLQGCGGTDIEPGNETDSSTAILICDQATAGIQNNNLDANAKAHLLCLHNKTRSDVALGDFPGLYGNLKVATDMKRLQWDDKLSQVAQGWADQCQWQHNSNRTTEYNALSPTDINGASISSNESVGENIAYYSSSSLTAANIDFALNGYTLWEEEGYEYSYGNLNVSDFCEADTCGHFTQLIWADTYKVGCAVNFCQAGTLSTYPSTYLVCNYASAGNYNNSTPYQTADSLEQVCSEADPSQSACKNGLTEAATYSTGL